MVTITQPQITTPEEYAPSVADRIQRVLYRLDHGEELISKVLHDGEKFCALGLFADESGIGNWDVVTRPGSSKGYYVFASDNPHSTLYPRGASILPQAVKELYNMKSDVGSFRMRQLPEDLRSDILKHLYSRPDYIHDAVKIDHISLANVNDILIYTEYEGINDMLARIIRSGVIFN